MNLIPTNMNFKQPKLFLLAALLSQSAICSAICINDTIVKVSRPDSIIVTEADSMTHIRIYGNEADKSYRFHYSKGYSNEAVSTIDEHAAQWDFNIPFLKKKKDSKKTIKNINCFNFTHFGLFIPVEKSSDISAKVGWNVSTDVLGLQYFLPSRRNILYIGIGLDCNLLKQHKGMQWVKQNDNLAIEPFPDETSKRKSWYNNISLTLPLRYSYMVWKEWEITFSAIPKYTIMGTVRNRYTIGNRRYLDEYKRFNERKISLDFSIDIHNTWGGIFVKYSPFTTFNTSDGTNYKAITLGFTL